MNPLHSLWLLFALISCCAANCCPEVCLLEDIPCVTRGSINVLKIVIAGANGLLKPLDPLYIKGIEGKRAATKYSLYNIELKGLRDCGLVRLTVNATGDESFAQYINCPKLRFKYEVTEVTGGFKRIKKVAVTGYNYDVINAGQYGVFVSAKDHQPHFFVKFVRIFVEHRGKLVFGNTNGQSVQQIGYEEKDTVEFLLNLIVKEAMKEVMAGTDTYVRTYLMGEVLPAYPY